MNGSQIILLHGQFSHSIRQILAEDPDHQNVPCAFQTYLNGKELRREKKRKQDKSCTSGGRWRSRKEISRMRQPPSLKGKLLWTERKQGKTADEI